MVSAAYDTGTQLGCPLIVASQGVELNDFQVPEPWAGDVGTAPVLFISSNPSISDVEPYQRWGTADEDRIEFFTDRYGDGPTQIRDGVYHPLKASLGIASYSKSGTGYPTHQANH